MIRRATSKIDHTSVVSLPRGERPTSRKWLWNWVRGYTGITLPHRPVCLDEGHWSPFDLFAEVFLERPDLVLWHGPRGSGKSFISALDTHMMSRFYARHGTRILGGSKAQSAQIYEALNDIVLTNRARFENDSDTVRQILATQAAYHNGSTVSILAASKTSVRGPHVPSLKLDEVDEIKPDIRESAVGMAMEKNDGPPTSILMTSTWHNVGGPMEALMERSKAGEFPSRTFCIFDVLERCPDSRSGPNLENCPDCKLVAHCHAGREKHRTPRYPGGEPKAKRSCGHYTINSLIQKIKMLSPKAFASDFLCLGPKAAGVWFTNFDEAIGRNVSTEARYLPQYPVHLSIDSGVITGGAFVQFRDHPNGGPLMVIFGEHLSDNIGAERAALEMKAQCGTLCEGKRQTVSTDPVGNNKNPIGPTVLHLYQQAGLCKAEDIKRWSHRPGSVKAGLDLLDALILAADGTIRLIIHPSCVNIIKAFRFYRRKCKDGVYFDIPEDPQHPWEDLIDAVRGAAYHQFPKGLVFKPEERRMSASQFFK